MRKVIRRKIKTMPIDSPKKRTDTAVNETVELREDSITREITESVQKILDEGMPTQKHSGKTKVGEILSASKLLQLDTDELVKMDINTKQIRGTVREKQSLRQRILEWRRKSQGDRKIMDAELDEIPFAWKNPLQTSPKGTYTSKLIKKINKAHMRPAD